MQASNDLLPCVEREIHTDASTPASASVIWLHGLGANGHDFAPVVPELGLPQSLALRFVFPHAPQIPVTMNGGMIMPAWYDILEMSLQRRVDLEQLLTSADRVRALVQRERERGIPLQRIVLAGFSQGGAVAYQTALTHPEPLAGLLAMSTYLANDPEPDQANAALPISIQHGEFDPVVPETLGQQACQALQALGYTPDYRRYPMEHQVCLEQIRDIGSWLQKVLAE